jgi:hypothetical protein
MNPLLPRGGCRAALLFFAVCLLPLTFRAAEPVTERRYLSGRSPADAVPWEFTVTGGRRAGEKATIPVPSQWELQGFGSYNYGQDAGKSEEHGLYRTTFHAPAEWRGRRLFLVFDGAMTDTRVTLNGKSAGPVHQGGFTRFRFDITPLVKLGDGAGNENVLEVDVAKVSADPQTEIAERGGDYWVFGGIYRSVYLEALPAQAIDHVALDARADGAVAAEVTLGSVHGGRTDGPNFPALRLEAQVLDREGRPFGAAFARTVPAGGAGRVRLEGRVQNPRLWTAETPHLYTLRLALRRGNEIVHVTETRFGFRTFEVRDGEGLFLNGQRILLKGVNRHSFRPETGRALTREQCYEDVRFIRGMNMNAVRMSHYPPDEAFLEACDELGLYVLDELSGWQRAHGTTVGRLLVREMVERDVNHPAILFWDNGNEGGWNRDLDGEFALYDPQRRRVLHPWNLHDGVDTKHYVAFDEFARMLKGPNLVMPTEILHALYDGGAGAGLADYWSALEASKVGAGLFIWDFADEAVVRTDRGGQLDAHSTYGADGIVGPHFEKEGSYYTVRDLWSPVQIERPVLSAEFSGTLALRNAYDFTSLAQCRFAWKLLRLAGGATQTIGEGGAAAPEVAPHAGGKLTLGLPQNWREADALAVSIAGPDGVELWTATWPTEKFVRHDFGAVASTPATTPAANVIGGEIQLVAGDVTATFDAASGMLRRVQRAGKTFALTEGPRLAFAHPARASQTEWRAWVETDASALTRSLAQPALANCVEVEFENLRGGAAWAGFKLELSADGQSWHTIFDGTRRPGDGARYEFPPQLVSAVRLSHLHRFDDAPAALRTYRVGYAGGRFPAAVETPARVTQGAGREGSGGTAAWLEASGGRSGLERLRWTLRSDGSLRLDYAYALEGEFEYHGVTFAHPEEQMQALRWLGEGPNRVWQNRLRGTWLGWNEAKRTAQQAGEAWVYPEFEGYFAGVRLAQLATSAGRLTIAPQPGAREMYLRVGTPRIDHPSTTIDFPAGNLSLVHAIPAIGSKGKPAPQAGPQSQPAKASGRYEGSVVFRFGE